MDPLAKAVLISYEAESSKLKTDLYRNLSKEENLEDFRIHGWVKSDHFPDGIDGKQLTITTYI